MSDVSGKPVRREDIGDLRFQEGTWVVLNSLCNDEGQPPLHGRLCAARWG